MKISIISLTLITYTLSSSSYNSDLDTYITDEQLLGSCKSLSKFLINDLDLVIQNVHRLSKSKEEVEERIEKINYNLLLNEYSIINNELKNVKIKMVYQNCYGITFFVKLKNLNHSLIIKRTLEPVMGTPGEVDILERLKNVKNIVNIIYSECRIIEPYIVGGRNCSKRKVNWIFFEYLNVDLFINFSNLKANKNQFNENCIRKVAYDILKGLEGCHKNDIVHCDVKLENIMGIVDQVTNELTFCLIDFGLSKHIDEDEPIILNKPIGTDSYMAPEVNNCILYKTSDIWSLGITLYRLIAVKHKSHNVKASQRFMRDRSDIPLRKLNCSNDMKKFLKDCLKVDPIDRPDAEELIDYDIFKLKM